MAYTKIHAIKATVNKAINYIVNPEKTNDQMLVTSFGCTVETAAQEFEYELGKTLTKSPNKAYHLIQSFMPGEVSYDEAHNIGIELADRLLESKFSYVIATHMDQNHIHNHIIFCAANNVDHRKYDDNKRSYHNIRNISDTLCQEHELSVIATSKKRGAKYNEWYAQKNGTSWKAKLKNDIDISIQSSKSYEHFIELMKAKGYEIKGECIGDNQAKYISFRPLESKQFIRGSDRSMGLGYTKENIKSRIDNNITKSKTTIPFPRKSESKIKLLTQEDLINSKRKTLQPRVNSTLIDTSTDKMKESPGLLRWANIQNLKVAAQAYALAGDINTLETNISEKKEIISAAKHSIVSLEKKMKPASEILHYAEIYTANLKYYNALKRSKDPDRYYREHDSQINLFNAAEHVLKDIYHINPSKINITHMRSSYSLMVDAKKQHTTIWKNAEAELHELEIQYKNLKQYLCDSASDQYLQSLSKDKEKETTKSSQKKELQ